MESFLLSTRLGKGVTQYETLLLASTNSIEHNLKKPTVLFEVASLVYLRILFGLLVERSVCRCHVYIVGHLRSGEIGEYESAIRLGFHRVHYVGALKCLCNLNMNLAWQLRAA